MAYECVTNRNRDNPALCLGLQLSGFGREARIHCFHLEIQTMRGRQEEEEKSKGDNKCRNMQ